MTCRAELYIGRIIEAAFVKGWIIERECENWIVVKVEGE
jgi:hypothetical protein